MTINRSLLAAALALTLTVGATSAAYAWGGGDHHDTPNHRIAEHGPGVASSAPQATTMAFNAHGGGHEQAPNNKALHEVEMKDPKHQDPAPAYEQHGGGHEQAADNAAVHEREMKDPNHRD